MNEIPPAPAGSAVVGVPPQEPARMSPLARYFNVFFSPGAVFEDVRRDPRGWWVPVLITAILTAALMMVYFGRFHEFQSELTAKQMKENAFLKLAPPEAREKAVDKAVQAVKATPLWQIQLQQAGQVPFGFMLAVWFFTLVYSIIALLMGWLSGARGSKLFINMGIILGICLVFFAVAAAVQIGAGAATQGEGSPPAWAAITMALGGLTAAALMLFFIDRLARQIEYGRIVGVVSYALAPAAIGALVGILIAFLKTPDPTPLQELVPSNLGALLGSESAPAWLASLASSLDIFTLWVMALATIGLSRVLQKSIGTAAAVVFTPWAIWVLLKMAFAAVGSMAG